MRYIRWMARKILSKPPEYALLMQKEFGRATRHAAARAELAGVGLAGVKNDADGKVIRKPAAKKVVAAKQRPVTAQRLRKKG